MPPSARPGPLYAAAAGWLASAVFFFGTTPLPASAPAAALALVLLFGVPGFLVCALLRLRLDGSPIGVGVAAFGIGVGVVLPLVHAVRLLGWPLASVGRVVCVAELLLLAPLVWQWRRGRLVRFEFGARGPAAIWADLSLPLWVAPLLAIHARFVQYDVRGGDWWVYLTHIHWLATHPGEPYRPHSENPEELAPRFLTNGWMAAEAALVELVGRDASVLDVWRDIPVLLIFLSAAAVYALAHSLFDRVAPRVLAVAAHVAVVLATLPVFRAYDPVQLRWPGFSVMYRIAEDKVVLGFVLVPMASLLAIHWLRERRGGYLVALALVCVGAVMTHPLGLPFIATLVGAYGALSWLAEPSRRTAAAVALMAAVLVPSVVWPLMQRGEVGELTAPTTLADDASFERLGHLTPRILWIQSREDNRFVSHPKLLGHPILLGAVLVGLIAGGGALRREDARYVFAASAAPVLLMYVPGVAPLAGRIVTPYLLWRFLWLLPYGLALAFAACWLFERLAAHGRRAARAGLVVAGLAGLVLAGGLARHVSAVTASIEAANPRPHPASLAVVAALERALDGPTRVMAPYGDHRSIVALVPDAQTVYWRRHADPERVAWAEAFYRLPVLGEEDLARIREFDIELVVVPVSAPVLGALAQRPDLFAPVETVDRARIYRFLR